MHEQLSSEGGSAWEYDRTRDQFYYHAFSKDAPDLNLRNEAVLEQLEVCSFNSVTLTILPCMKITITRKHSLEFKPPPRNVLVSVLNWYNIEIGLVTKIVGIIVLTPGE